MSTKFQLRNLLIQRIFQINYVHIGRKTGIGSFFVVDDFRERSEPKEKLEEISILASEASEKIGRLVRNWRIPPWQLEVSKIAAPP